MNSFIKNESFTLISIFILLSRIFTRLHKTQVIKMEKVNEIFPNYISPCYHLHKKINFLIYVRKHKEQRCEHIVTGIYVNA